MFAMDSKEIPLSYPLLVFYNRLFTILFFVILNGTFKGFFKPPRHCLCAVEYGLCQRIFVTKSNFLHIYSFFCFFFLGDVELADVSERFTFVWLAFFGEIDTTITDTR